MKLWIWAILLLILSPVLAIANQAPVLVGLSAQNSWFIATDGDDASGDGSELDPFASLRQAVMMAASGDTIIVADGIYSGSDNCNINIENKTLTIISESMDPGLCIFELAGSDGINVQRTDETIEVGFFLRGIAFTGGADAVFITGFLHPGEGPQLVNLEVEYCLFAGNIAGLKIGYYSALIQDCVFDGNSDTGIGCYNNIASSTEINRCHFENNGFGMTSGYGDIDKLHIPRAKASADLDCSESVFIRNGTGLRLSVDCFSANFTSCRMDSNTIDGCELVGACTGLFTFTNCQLIGNARFGAHLREAIVALTMNNCQVMDNGSDGLAVESGCGGDLLLTDVMLLNNGGFGFVCAGGSYPAGFVRCTVSNNNLGGIKTHGAYSQLVQECLIVDNNGDGIVALDSGSGSGTQEISNCTVAGNTGVGLLSDFSETNISNTIIAFNSGAAATLTNSSILTMSCNDIYGNNTNYAGDLESHLGFNGNISVLPMFCGSHNPDNPYTLAQNSPCIPANNMVCDLMGALDVGCDDYTPTGPVSDVVAETGHQKVTLNWTPPGDADYDGAVIYRTYWENGSGESAYPTYGLPGGDVIAERPVDAAAAEASSQWNLAGVVTSGAQSFVDTIATRGLLFYEVFASDTAGNIGTPAAGQVLAANYWLGDMDVSRDGEVTVADISTLGATYGASTGDGFFNNEGDVGPTDDGSGSGIPQPDGYVGFEDLMIVSMNYGIVFPDKSAVFAAEPVALSWGKVSDKEWVCRLESAGGSFKGLHLAGSLPAGVQATCSAGDLIAQQDAPVFLRNADPGGLDIGLAIMGQGVLFEESGVLIRVLLSEAVDLSDAIIEARGAGNEAISLIMDSTPGLAFPMHYHLGQNYPNPFNPMTTVSFDLPKEGVVRVTVYSVDGRLVKVLAAGHYKAGSHDLVWKGEDETGRRVASGTYFCRMESGKFGQIVKMVLAR